MKTYKITIIIPVYNVENYLEACLNSLVGQTLENIEIVAVNDGSTDSSLSILNRFQKKYPEKLFVYTTKNHGVSHARNYGFTKAHGEYIWFVDSDDYVETDACEKLYDKALRDGNDLVLFNYCVLDAKTGKRHENPFHVDSQNFTLSEKPYEIPSISLYPWNKLIKRELFTGLGFPEGIRFEDVPVSFAVCAKASSIGFINEYFYNYIKNIGFSDTLTETTLDIRTAHDLMRRYMKEFCLYDRFYQEFDYVTVRHFFLRFSRLLTNYETDKKELKLRMINELYDYLDTEIPYWRDNHYIRYFLQDGLYRMLPLYGSREELLRFIENCDGMEPQKQDAWLKNLRDSYEKGNSTWFDAWLEETPESQIQSAAREYHTYSKEETNLTAGQVFFQSDRGLRISESLLSLVIAFAEHAPDFSIFIALSAKKQTHYQELLRTYHLEKRVTFLAPHTESCVHALSTSEYVITDCSLPSYFAKKEKQVQLFVCSGDFQTFLYSRHNDKLMNFELLQHTLLTADAILFPEESMDASSLKTYLVQNLCEKKELLPADLSADFLRVPGRREDIRRELHLSGKQIIGCSPLFRGQTNTRQAIRTCRKFISHLYQLDQELNNDQILFVDAPYTPVPICYEEFAHIRPLPEKYVFYDFLNACDVFVTDYHPAIQACAQTKLPVLRFLFTDGTTKQEISMEEKYRDFSFRKCHTVPELAAQLTKSEYASAESAENPGADAPVVHSGAHNASSALDVCRQLTEGIFHFRHSTGSAARKQILYFVDRKLTDKMIQDFNTLVKRIRKQITGCASIHPDFQYPPGICACWTQLHPVCPFIRNMIFRNPITCYITA